MTPQKEAYQDVDVVIQRLTDLMDDHRVFLLRGDLGAGKTYLVQRWMAHIGILDQVTSPTFSLINHYRGEGQEVYHMDMYRLNTLEEAMGLGLMEYLELLVLWSS